MFPIIPAMHIPDGFLSLPVTAIGWLILILALTLALRQTGEQLRERQIPLMGIMGAFIFAAQMLNFPVAGGTSGHLMGGALVAIFLGPWAAVLVMTSVIGVQSLLFQDGGLLALGFNAVNMAVVSSFVGYSTYRLVIKLMGKTATAQLIGAGLGAWLSVVVASIATALQLGISATSPLEIALPAMVGVHALIGIGEALVTVSAIVFVRQTRPDLLEQTEAKTDQGYGWVVVGFMIAIVLTFASPFADANPDGLERVAEDQGFSDTALDPAYTIFPDYTVPLVTDDALTTILAGILGVIVVGGISLGVAKIAHKTQLVHTASHRDTSPDHPQS